MTLHRRKRTPSSQPTTHEPRNRYPTHVRTATNASPSRSRLAHGMVATFALLVVACAPALTSANDDRPDAMLDLATLESETEHGTLQAERIDPSFVSALGEGRAIGIEVQGTPTGDGAQEVLALLYERRCVAVLHGTLDAEGTATLTSDELSDFDATVEVTVADDLATGTATLDGATTTFTATAATGVAGVYHAQGTDRQPDASGSWVVLPDERQWGCVCAPPSFMGPCCEYRR